MVKLTEEMIIARTRVSDMANVKKLNCWGAELTDISVLRKLTNVEVLSLSVNCITTLADIQNCRQLKELYIRKNKIPDLNELCWLRELSTLKSLWLEENPCVQDHGELYRVTVIRNLPQLQKLDNVDVQPDEMADAMRRGMELVHPHDVGEQQQPYQSMGYQQQDDRRGSRGSYYETAPPPPASSNGASADYYQAESEQQQSSMSRRQSMQEQQSSHAAATPSRRVSNQVFDSSPSPRSSQSPKMYGSRRSSVQPTSTYMTAADDGNGYVPEYHTGRRYSTQEGPCRRSPRMSTASLEDSARRMSVHDSYEDERNANNGYVQQRHSQQQQQHYSSGPPEPSYGYQGGHYEQRSYHSTESGRAVVAQHYEQTYDQVNQQIDSAQQHIQTRKSFSPDRAATHLPRRPKNRNSNILSAVLCLIKELDGPSLEVAEMAVRCRMEELED